MSEEGTKLQDVENEEFQEPEATEENLEEEENCTTLHMVDVPNMVKNMGLQQRYCFGF